MLSVPGGTQWALEQSWLLNSHYATLREEEKKTQDEQCLVIREEFAIIYLSPPFPPITFPLALEVEHKKVKYFPQQQIGLYRQSQRAEGSISGWWRRTAALGDMPWVLDFLGALISFHWAEYQTLNPMDFLNLSGCEEGEGLSVFLPLCVQKPPPPEFKQVFMTPASSFLRSIDSEPQ